MCIVGGTYQAKCVHQTVIAIGGGQKFPGCPSNDNESHPVEWILTGIPAMTDLRQLSARTLSEPVRE